MPETSSAAWRAGFADYWTKPIDFAAFLAALKQRFPDLGGRASASPVAAQAGQRASSSSPRCLSIGSTVGAAAAEGAVGRARLDRVARRIDEARAAARRPPRRTGRRPRRRRRSRRRRAPRPTGRRSSPPRSPSPRTGAGSGPGDGSGRRRRQADPLELGALEGDDVVRPLDVGAACAAMSTSADAV